jgi:hypothetical protein
MRLKDVWITSVSEASQFQAHIHTMHSFLENNTLLTESWQNNHSYCVEEMSTRTKVLHLKA